MGKREKEEVKPYIVSMYLILVGVALLGIFSGSLVSAEFSPFMFGVGAMLCMAGTIHFCVTLYRTEKKRLLENGRGVAWIWAVCLITIIVLVIAWFALSYPTLMLIDTVTGNPNWPSEYSGTVTIIRNVIQWFLILMVFGLLIWAYVSSQRPQEVSYPY